MTPLSSLTQRLVQKIFPNNIEEVSRILEEECGQNLPFLEKATPETLQRFRFAALKLGAGDMEKFLRAIQIAKQDWRDLLVGAGFGSDLEAHETWAREILGR